ncbi:MAG: ABC transporter permease [Blautia sp.]|nr:ABC transporter permease [Lachnoclostridium sp.]MCM1210715.1 ABC transporter permease [Blautia sp.]
MNTKIIKTLVKKEMLDVFRDKKTVIMMLVVPVILYPLIFIGVMQVVAAISSSMGEQTYRVVIEAEDDGAFLEKLMHMGEKEPEGEASEESTEETEEASGSGYSIQIVDAASIEDYETALEMEEIDVYIAGGMENGKLQYDIYYLSSETNSSYAMNLVMDAFEEFREEMTEEKIREAGLNVQEILEPVLYEEQDTASSEQSLGSIMGSILPFMLIVSLLMGTMYPAIDTTAGERERGTLETILTLPVTNRQLIVSKFLTVAVIGMISALLNILSMGGIAFYMYQIMDMEMSMQTLDLTQFLPAILVCILAIFAFSLFISAITMCVTAFAKSYKEANNYITPLMLVVMFTGYIGFIPNVELTQTMAMIPVANICLLIKNMLLFKIDYMTVAMVLLSNVAYAALAILFLSKIYDSEAILFGDGKGGLQLFEKRSNLQKGGVPTVSDVGFVVAVTIVLVLYAGSMLQLKFGLAGVFGTQMILLFVPLAVVLYTKKDIRLTYGFQKTGISGYLGGLFLIVGAFLVNIVLSYGLMRLFPQSTSQVNDTFSSIMSGGVLESLFVIALAPAVCEEMLFRGFIFHSVKAKYRIFPAMMIVAVLFGIYHMSLVKFIPTGFLGMVLCYVVYRTGSIYPSMMMHFLNNAFSVLISYYPETLQNVLPVFYQETISVSDGLILFGIGLVSFGIGGILLRRSTGAGKENGGNR